MSQYQEKLSIIRMLVQLSTVDGEMTENEIAFIDRMVYLYQIEDIDLLKIKAGDFDSDLLIPDSEAERIPFFQTCVMAMGLDDEVGDKERTYCHELGMKMGLREIVIENIMALFEQYFPQPVPMDELMKVYNMGRN